MQASKLLFDEGESDEPSLFGGPSELAAFLVENDLYPGKVTSVSAFLSQVIQRGERSCPERLKLAIRRAVELKLADEPAAVRERQSERIRRALEVDDLVRRTAQPLSAESLYYELQNLAETASEHYIITARPAEEVLSDRAASLRGILLERLGLSNLISGTVTARSAGSNIETHYTFCLPSEEAAIRWWRALFHEIRASIQANKKPFDPKPVHKAIRRLDEADVIRVFAVPPFLCGCPVAVFDPNSPDPSGFVLYYHVGGQTDLVSVAKMDATYLQSWKELVHNRLEIDEVSRRRVSYESVEASKH